MIKGVVYSQGELKKVEIKNINFISHLSWVDGINCPVLELKQLSEKLKIPVSALKHSFDTNELPRVHTEKDYTFIIFKAIKNNKNVTLGIFLGRKFLITLHDDDLHFQLQPEHLKKGTAYALSQLLFFVIAAYTMHLDKIDEELTNAERKIMEIENPHFTLYEYKRKLLYIRKALTANRDVLRKIENSEYITNLSIEINQLIELESTLASRLTDILDLQSHRISNNLNNIMKSFTVIASLLLLPMLISGIYGMNFKMMPLINNSGGFYYSILIMFGSVFLMILYFKKKKWI